MYNNAIANGRRPVARNLVRFENYCWGGGGGKREYICVFFSLACDLRRNVFNAANTFGPITVTRFKKKKKKRLWNSQKSVVEILRETLAAGGIIPCQNRTDTANIY